MDAALLHAAIDHLKSFATEPRVALIDQVLQHRTRHLTVVLEDVYQPHNASAILRTCECLGIQDVHVLERRYRYRANRDIVMGANKWVTLHRRPNGRGAIDQFAALRRQGYRIAAFTPNVSATDLDSVDLTHPLALVFGTELDGLSQDSLADADLSIALPIYGFTQSYNVSVTVALTLQSLLCRLRQSDIPWRLGPQDRDHLMLEWLCRSVRAGNLILKRFVKNYEINATHSISTKAPLGS